MRPKRFSSLFWIFAGSFLAMSVVVAILHFLVVHVVIEPLATQWAESQAKVLAGEAAVEITAALEQSPDADIPEILRQYSSRTRAVILFYRDATGQIISNGSFPPQGRRWRRLRHELADTSGVFDFPPPPRGRPRPGSDRDRGRHRIISRSPVVLSSGPAGEVVALGMPRQFHLWPRATPWPVFLSLPIAVIVAGAASLIVFRIILRRLRALDQLAARVTAGDLDARILNPGKDEIGQLGSRMNRMTEALAEARQHVEQGESQRRQLLADISHELATPMTSIRGYAETLLAPEVTVSPEERSTYLHDILEESQRMEFLIEDLLDLTRLEAGANNLVSERLDWSALCRNTLDRYLPRFREAELKLEWTGADEPAWITADGRRMEQVLENLLVNTLRYVPAGGKVQLGINQISVDELAHHRLTVSDNGPGIPAADLPHVFDRFYRADSARTSSVGSGGSGLGLAIVQEIIRRHDGRVRAEKLSPTGTMISVELPVA